MAIFYTYPEVTPVLEDILLISQTNDKKKNKTITIQGLKDLIYPNLTLDVSFKNDGATVAIKDTVTNTQLGQSFAILPGSNTNVSVSGQEIRVNSTVVPPVGGTLTVQDGTTAVATADVLNLTGKIYEVSVGSTPETADVAAKYNTEVSDATLTVADVGSIPAGTPCSDLKGDDIVDLLNKMFFPTQPPTYIQPTMQITGSSLPAIEVGTTIGPTLDMTFIKKDSGGFIAPMVLERNGAGLTPINETTTQSADIPDQFPGVPNTNNPQFTTTASYTDSYLVTAPTNVTSVSIAYEATADYSQGNVLNDSTGNPSGTAIPAGDESATKTYTAYYPWYYYFSSNPITDTDMVTAIANGTATKNIANSQGQLDVPFNITAQFVAVAYPTSSTVKTKYFVSNFNAGPITAIFDPVTVKQVTEQGGLWNNIDYNIHVSFNPQTSTTTPLQLRNN